MNTVSLDGGDRRGRGRCLPPPGECHDHVTGNQKYRFKGEYPQKGDRKKLFRSLSLAVCLKTIAINTGPKGFRVRWATDNNVHATFKFVKSPVPGKGDILH